jgi:dTDP-4-amino-4,6-dideoxygalactose transaminase
MMEKMEKDGIMTDKPVWDWTGSMDSIPVSKMAYNQILSLPCYPTLKPNEQDRVIESFLKHIS